MHRFYVGDVFRLRCDQAYDDGVDRPCPNLWDQGGNGVVQVTTLGGGLCQVECLTPGLGQVLAIFGKDTVQFQCQVDPRPLAELYRPPPEPQGLQIVLVSVNGAP